MIQELSGGHLILNDVVAFLEKVPPFQTLSRSELKSVARKVSMEFYPKGTEVLTQGGTPSTHLYVIQKGGVKIFIRPGNEEVVIDYRSEGESFGFVSLYSGDKSRTNIVAIEDTICYLIDRETFFRLHDTNPYFAEYFLKSYLKKYIDKTFVEMYEKDFLYRAGSNLPFSTFVRDATSKKLITATLDATVQGVAQIMAANKISSIVLVDGGGNPVGIITDRDMREKVVANGLSVDTPAKEIMSTELRSVQANDYCFEASLQMIRHGIHHLLVMSGEKLVGIVTNHDLMMLQGISPITVARDIENRTNVDCLIPIAHDINNVVGMMLKEGAKASNIARILAELNDRLLNKIIELEVKDLGEPPVPFAWLVFGSEGRKEQTFKTDQDNALIYADPANQAEQEAAEKYFAELARRVNDDLIRSGFPPCPADYMARNPKWRKPLKAWKSYFTEWLLTSTPQAILLSSILFDFRPVYGEAALAETLRNHLMQTLREERFFLARMGASIVDNRPPLGFFKTFVVEKSGEHKNELNLKISAASLLVDIVRLFSLEKGVRETSTLERLNALKGVHSMVDEFADELEQAFEFIMLLRVLNQYEQIQSGLAPDNFINPHKLSTLEKQTLKEVFQLINRIQDLIDQRYRLGTVS